MQINFINDRNQDILLLLCSFVYFTLSIDFKHITCICFYTCHHNFMTEILPERLKSKLINQSYNCIPCQMFTSLFLSTDHSFFLRWLLLLIQMNLYVYKSKTYTQFCTLNSFSYLYFIIMSLLFR